MIVDTTWRIELFGGLKARQGDRVIARFSTHKTGGLLAYLAYHQKRAHTREEIAEYLWPEVAPEVGRHNLRQTLLSLRRQMEPPGASETAAALFLVSRSEVRLSPAVTTDVAEFEAALKMAEPADADRRAEHLARAVELYLGELLPGHFDEWVLIERGRLADACLGALRQLVQLCRDAGETDRAIQYAHRAVAMDPLREESHLDLMRLYVMAGRPAEAQRQYQELERVLREEMDASPSAEALALARDLPGFERGGPSPKRPVPPGPQPRSSSFTAATPARATSPAPPASFAPAAPRLPIPVTRFFGREPELERLALWLRDPAVRLITLTGAGGAGKTRLAIEAAMRAAADEEADAPKLCGPWFVPLADRAGAPAIIDALADAILLPAAGEAPLFDQIVSFLTHAGQSAPCLLILDNFEHLIEPGAALLATLIERVPNLKCLVTSRQLLEIAGEHELAVLPLPVPGVQAFRPDTRGAGDGVQAGKHEPVIGTVDVEYPNARTPERLNALLTFPSVQLFLDRARASRPDFAVTPRNAAAVASLCERLEGMPLALELAAARAQMLTPSQMLTQLEARFDFLVSRRRDIPPRHRTLRAAMAWSYELLSPDLRQFFARLSVFKGRWTLAAAEAVCGSIAGRAAALDYLTELRERSLILVIEGDEEMAYRMLETLREYAAEQLEPTEQAALRRRHAEFYLALAEEAGKHLHGPQQSEWLDHLEADHDNFRAALAWSRDDTGARETGLRLAGLLHFFWNVRNHVSEGRRWLTELLPASAESEPTAALASALYGAACLAATQGDLTAAAWHYSQCLEIRQTLGDQQGIADTLCQWGHVADRMGDRMAARSLFAQSEVIYRAIGDKGGLAHVLKCTGAATLTQGELDRARVLFEESVALYRELQNARGLVMMLGEMAHLALLQAEYERASVMLREHIELSRQLKDTGHTALALRNLAYAVRNEGDYPGAQALFEESLALWRDLGEQHQIAEILVQIGSLQWLQGQASAAKVSFEQGLTLLRELKDPKTVSGCLELLASVALGPAGAQVPAAAAARSARLFAAAEAFRASVDAPGLWPAEREARERALPLIRTSIGNEGLERSWTEGRALTLDQAINEADRVDP